jgi:hypothetical protein
MLMRYGMGEILIRLLSDPRSMALSNENVDEINMKWATVLEASCLSIYIDIYLLLIYYI